MGTICSTRVHSQIHLHYTGVCAKFIPNWSSRLTTFPRLLNCWSPKLPPKCRRGVSWGELFLAYVHSRMNPQTWTEFGANRSIRLTAFPDLNWWPPKTPEMPPVVLRGELYLAIFIPRRIRIHVPNLVPISRAVWQLPQTFEFVTPKPPPPKCPLGVLWGDLYLAYVHCQMNPQTWTKVGANRSSRWTASQDFWKFDPLKPPSGPLCLEGQFVWCISIPRWICTCVPNLMPIGPALNLWPPKTLKKMPHGILRGELYLAYVHSQTNPPTCTKVSAVPICPAFDSFPYFLMFDPLKPPSAPH